MNEYVQQAIDDINQFIVTNGNKDITAEVLNPILLQMIESLYSITGNNDDLTFNPSDTLVQSINRLKTYVDGIESPISVYYGTNNPNVVLEVTNPQFGDIYVQVDGSSRTIGYFVYTGISWVNLVEMDYSVKYTPQVLTLTEKGIARDNLGITSLFDEIFIYNSVTNPNKIFNLAFKPTQVDKVSVSSTLIWADDGDFEINLISLTTTLKINVALRDGDKVRIAYFH